MVQVRDAVPDDVPALLTIYNDAVRNLTATFDLEEQSLEQRMSWFQKHGGRYPLIVADLDGYVGGYCSLSRFREKPAYADTAELSVYIASERRGQGLGKMLVLDMIRRAGTLGFHTVIGGITGDNAISIALHKKLGFEFVGCFKEVGHKFGSWHDVHFYQYMIRSQEGDSE